MNADCESPGPATITGPQGTTTVGGITLAVTTSKTTVGLKETFILTVRITCIGNAGFGTGVCEPGDYDLAFSSGAKVTPSSALTKFSVALVPAVPRVPEFPLGCDEGAPICTAPGVQPFCSCTTLSTPAVPATVTPLTGGFFVDTVLTASASGTAVITGTFSGLGIAITTTVEVKII